MSQDGGQAMTGPVKQAAHLQVSLEDLADADAFRRAFARRTPEQRRQAERQHRARIAALKAGHASLVANTPWLLRGVAELHAPDDEGACTGCDLGANAEPPDWPCRTIDTIQEALPNPDQEAP